MKELILYGHNGCPHCVHAKDWLEKNSVPYTMKDTTEPANQTEFQQYNSPGVPLLIIKDDKDATEQKILGFNKDRYEKTIL
ncbi:glutaredoxin family protein [Bacillus bombysepticus]|uniref:glutaredoxin family protein n=1 Tax=Bacillus bombysepticus TaxID=658666 RepID=UPI003018167B